MDRLYGGIVWTDHALAKLSERGIKQGDAWATWRRPDQSRQAHQKGNWVYCKTFGNQKIEVVTAKNQKGETVVLSVWSSPNPPAGEVGGSVETKGEPLMEKILKFLLGWARPPHRT